MQPVIPALLGDIRSKRLRRTFSASAPAPLPSYLASPPRLLTLPRARPRGQPPPPADPTAILRSVHIRMTESGYCFWNRRGRKTPWRLGTAIKRRSTKMQRLQIAGGFPPTEID